MMHNQNTNTHYPKYSSQREWRASSYPINNDLRRIMGGRGPSPLHSAPPAYATRPYRYCTMTQPTLRDVFIGGLLADHINADGFDSLFRYSTRTSSTANTGAVRDTPTAHAPNRHYKQATSTQATKMRTRDDVHLSQVSYNSCV